MGARCSMFWHNCEPALHAHDWANSQVLASALRRSELQPCCSPSQTPFRHAFSVSLSTRSNLPCVHRWRPGLQPHWWSQTPSWCLMALCPFRQPFEMFYVLVTRFVHVQVAPGAPAALVVWNSIVVFDGTAVAAPSPPAAGRRKLLAFRLPVYRGGKKYRTTSANPPSMVSVRQCLIITCSRRFLLFANSPMLSMELGHLWQLLLHH